MTIFDALIPRLQAEFSDYNFRILGQPQSAAVFPAICAEVGNVMIYDAGNEATIVIENVTHHHTLPCDETMSKEKCYIHISNEIVEFLRDLFADRVLLWSIDQGKGGRGWRRFFEGRIPPDVPAKADLFVWSQKLEKSG